MNKTIAYGLKLALFNFVVVAILGVTMRYKIAYSFPFFDQKNLQEAHSHFAFFGWLTTAIYLLILKNLRGYIPELKSKPYLWVIVLNLIASYGMLITFTYKGYYLYSIIFSGLALFCSLLFIIILYRDIRGRQLPQGIWYFGGLIFALISTAGVYVLSHGVLTRHITTNSYLAFHYFYLHFQYNGLFIFAAIGLLLSRLSRNGILIDRKLNKRLFYLMFFGCFVGYGLSILWLDLPVWFFILIILGSIAQTYGTILLIQFIRKNWKTLKEKWSPLQRFILVYVGLAFVAKILLQLGSNSPAISKFAFGFRDIVIAYLHLALLMCIATYLLMELFSSSLFKKGKLFNFGVWTFLLGVFLNEFFLGINGILSIDYRRIPDTQYIMVYVSLLILLGLIIIVSSLHFNKEAIDEKRLPSENQQP